VPICCEFHFIIPTYVNEYVHIQLLVQLMRTMKARINALSVAIGCASIASSIPEIRLLAAHNHTQCEGEKTSDYNFTSVAPNIPRSIHIIIRQKMANALRAVSCRRLHVQGLYSGRVRCGNE